MSPETVLAPSVPARPVVSVVVPAFNEVDNVGQTYVRLRDTLEGIDLADWEIIFSVDPCTDGTEDVILALREGDHRVKLLRLSRRFGQAAATMAGMEASIGDACVVIDCDLQDPPEVIADMVAKWREGYEVVYARRRSRAGEPWTKRIAAKAAYRLINRLAEGGVDIPVDTGDFRLMSRRVVDHVTSLNEAHNFLKGLVSLVGFRQTAVLYDRQARAAGKTKYGRFVGSFGVGLNGIVGFSSRPLKWIAFMGFMFSVGALLLATVYLIMKLVGFGFPLGNPTIVILIAFFAGVQLLSLGIMGEYVGRIYDEVKRRPKFIVESAHGIVGHRRDRRRWPRDEFGATDEPAEQRVEPART